MRIVFLPDRPIPEMGNVPANNEIDRLVFAQLRKLRLKPADLAPDHVFLRRAYLDALGILPTVEEARAFLADTDPKKREKLIDRLLARPEFAEYWAQKWSDLLRNEEKALDKKGVAVFYRWIAAQLAADRPLNEFARDILAATRQHLREPAGELLARRPRPDCSGPSRSRRCSSACASAAPAATTTRSTAGRSTTTTASPRLFGRIDYRVLENKRKDDLDKHEFVGEQIVFQNRDGEMHEPAHEAAREAGLPRRDRHPTFGADADRLAALADWVAAPDNPFFAQAQVNRVWLHLMGRGLVDPNDDFRATNPPTNPELLDWLAKDFAAGGFRLKPLVKRIMMSRVVSTRRDDPRPPHDGRRPASLARARATARSGAAARRAGAGDRRAGAVQGLPAGLAGEPGAGPAAERPPRLAATGMGERFLKVFGKPDRLLTCECERSDDPGLMQAFQLITGELTNALIRDPDNRIGKLLSAGKTDAEMLEELYLAALCRKPTEAEAKKLLALLAGAKDRRAAWEDVLWAVVNSKEFLLRR